jgi:phosphatidylserine/phosphatidylglycerophosphate/cardiolipin synthase-like enzyme
MKSDGDVWQNGPEVRRILLAGKNCWRVEEATRAKLLSNSHYFRALARSLERARRSITLIGWDLDARLILDPESDDDARLPLIEFLCGLLDRAPILEIRILLWDRPIFYGGNRKSSRALKRARHTHERLFYHYREAGFGASDHAKLVCIDDEIAFIGGIDLTARRWDPEDHPPVHPARVTPDGENYGPVHDLQMLLAGPVARALSEYAHDSWRAATGESLRPPTFSSDQDAWPDGFGIEFEKVAFGIARTEPRIGVTEIDALNRAAVAAAKHHIYIETQYLTSEAIGESLARRLAEPAGPEIVVIVTRASAGLVERFAMGHNRDRLLRRLATVDRWDRFRVYCPTIRNGPVRIDVKIHAKLMIVDDCFLRVGSSNFNNRSMVVDTECDVALEAGDTQSRLKISDIRNRLLGEQLNCQPREVAAVLGQQGSLVHAIEALNGERRLQPLYVRPKDGPVDPLMGTAFLDPKGPLPGSGLWQRLRSAIRRMTSFF